MRGGDISGQKAKMRKLRSLPECGDYPILMGILMIVAALTVVSNLIADVLYAVLDPKVQYK